MNEYGYYSLVVIGYFGEVDILRDWRLKNDDGMVFYFLRKKGIIFVKDVLSEF